MTDAQRTPTEIDRVAEAWVDTDVDLHPETAVFLGRPGHEGRYSDYSPDGLAADADARRAVAARLRDLEPADETDRITKLDLLRDLELELEVHDAGWALRNVANIESPVQNIRDIIDLEPTGTATDWEVIARRLRAIPEAIAGYETTLRLGVQRGIVAAARQVALGAGQAREFAAPDGFFADLAASGAAHAAVGEALARELAAAAAGAAAAYTELAETLEREVAPAAGEEDAVGRELYSLLSRRALGARIDLDETYEWGLAELAALAAEQAAVAREIVPGGTVEDAIVRLDEDAAHALTSPDALREWMQGLSDRAVAALGGTEFDIAEPVRRLECRIAPTHSGVIYYTPPSDDFSRPGRMWWSVPAGVERFSTWRETTVVYHEGVPGHHLQFATALTNRDLNAWRRMTFTSGYAEGWALYAERLMADFGFLDDPADRLGMLDGQRMRAARVVVDLGIHLGKQDPDGRVWTRDSALELLRRHVHLDDAFLRFEVDRYCGWPGQAPAYKVGQRIWEGLRDESRRRAGDAWDQRAWHAQVLPMGAMGLDTLRSALLG